MSLTAVLRSLIVCCLVTAPAYAAADSYWVGLASFRGITNAERYRDDAAPSFAERLTIRQFDGPQGTYFRVMAGPYVSEGRARTAVTELRQRGFDTAWYVIERGEPTLIASPTPAPAPAAPPSPGVPVAQPREASPDAQAPVAPAEAAVDEALPEEVRVAAQDGRSIRLPRVSHSKIRIDGFVDEAAWQSVPYVDEFRVIEPDTLTPGIHPTQLRVAYSDRGIYASAVMQQPPDSLVGRLTGRDVRDNRDSVSITLDTSGEGRYGFWFGVNLGDSLMDGTVLPERQFSSDWDGPWVGRSQRLDDGWSAEFFIPWGVVAMPAAGEVRDMGMYVSRKVAYLDERWAWPALAPTQAKFMSALQTLEMRRRATASAVQRVSVSSDGPRLHR